MDVKKLENQIFSLTEAVKFESSFSMITVQQQGEYH